MAELVNIKITKVSGINRIPILDSMQIISKEQNSKDIFIKLAKSSFHITENFYLMDIVPLDDIKHSKLLVFEVGEDNDITQSNSERFNEYWKREMIKEMNKSENN